MSAISANELTQPKQYRLLGTLPTLCLMHESLFPEVHFKPCSDLTLFSSGRAQTHALENCIWKLVLKTGENFDQRENTLSRVHSLPLRVQLLRACPAATEGASYRCGAGRAAAGKYSDLGLVSPSARQWHFCEFSRKELFSSGTTVCSALEQ